MTATSLTILVDHRERGSGVDGALLLLGAHVEWSTLAVADYVVARGVAVERKTVRDLHCSIRDGRLWRQIASLRADLDAAFLVVEGEGIDRGPVSRAGVRGAVLEVISLGIPVIFSRDHVDTAEWIARIAARAQRRGPPGRPRRSRPRPAATPEAVLCSIPGISSTIAAQLLDRFGNVASIANATAREIRDVPGLGPVRAARLVAILHEHVV